MLINLYVLNDEYNKYIKYRDRFYFIKKEKWEFYKNHKEEIDENLDKYMNIENEKEEKDFLNKHKILKTHLVFNMLAQRYKTEYRYYLSSVNPYEKHRMVIALKHDNDDSYDLYDLETKEVFPLSKFDEEKQKYIIEGLKRSDSFITFAEKKHLPLLKVIVNDIKYKYKNLPDEKVYTCADINLDFIKANLFDNPAKNLKKKNPETYEYEIKNLKNDLLNKKITQREYYIRYYYYVLLIERNVEEIYLNANDVEKEYIIEAYYRLSSYSEQNSLYPYHERTQSPIINNAVLRRKYKNNPNN